jgi:hypothetical protein
LGLNKCSFLPLQQQQQQHKAHALHRQLRLSSAFPHARRITAARRSHHTAFRPPPPQQQKKKTHAI